MKMLAKLEQDIYNEGERLIPGVTHDVTEVIRHRSSYLFFKKVIELDMEKGCVSKPVKIVDLGCGVGHGCEILSKIPGSQILGVDMSAESLEYAEKFYSGKNISYRRADLKEFIAAMPEFDYVVSRGVMEHVPDGLNLISTAKWLQRLLFDVPYDEQAGNQHHLLLGIREKDFSGFHGAELFYEDLEGVIYDTVNGSPKPNMIMCVCSRQGLVRLKDARFNFPMPAWKPRDGVREGNNIVWLESEEMIPSFMGGLKPADVLLDIGCGIMPQPYVTPKVHICCEPFKQYVEAIQERFKGATDRVYVVLNSTWEGALRLFPPKSVDTVFLVDVIEHLDKEEGARLLKATQDIVRGQIVLFTPLGFMPQVHADGKDAWKLDGGAWQEHKSGWLSEDFDENWKLFVCKDFHKTDSMGNSLDRPFGAFWAIWEAPQEEGAQAKTFQDAPKSLWQNFTDLQQAHQQLQQAHQQLQQANQQLQQEHQALAQSRAVQFARELGSHPVLLKAGKLSYGVLARIFKTFKGK